MEQKQLDLFEEHSSQEARDINPTTQKVDFLALSSIRGIGFQTLRKIYERYGRFDSVWLFSEIELHQFASNLSRNELSKIIDTLKTKKSSLIEKAEITLKSYQNRNIDIVFRFEPSFPKKLSRIPDPPYWLFVEGSQKLLAQDNLIAIVGSRSASYNGINVARRLSFLLSKNGFPIVSGLAEGIDATAQQTAVDYGNKCVAVLGTGISVVFPASTASLRDRIAQSGGTIITEYLPNDSYSKSRFIQRNRIQAAISCLIIPVEWSVKGGTAHTIRYAEKYRRPVIFLRGLQDNTVEANASLYTSSNNRYFIDVNSPSLENEIITIFRDLKIKISRGKKSYSESKDIFRSVIDEYSRLIENYDISESDFARLLEDLKKRWLKRRSIDER